MITTIIVNYKTHALTIRAAQSVKIDDPYGQVVVVDNSEDSLEAAALRAGLPSGVDFYVSPKNVGFGKACNYAFSKAKHDFIFLLNPDAVVKSGCLQELQLFLETQPRFGAVSPCGYWDDACSWYLPPGQMPSPAMNFALSLSMRFPSLGQLVGKNFRKWALRKLTGVSDSKVRMLSGGHVLLKRSAIVAAGGLFDENFFMYFEDTDLCRRIHAAGYSLHLLATASVTHFWQCNPGKSRLGEASESYYIKKHFSKSQWHKVQRILERYLPMRLPPSIDIGVATSPPCIQVPEGWQSAWLMEGSPHPLMVPAVYSIGRGAVATFSDEVWCLLGEGNYWIQLSPMKDGKPQSECVRYTFRIVG